MHIISRKRLSEAGRKHRDAILPLDAWYRAAKASKWRNLEEVRRTYAHADGVPAGERTYTIFNIAGNKYRLITEIYNEDQTILLRDVLTHAEYDREDWKK
ncbi:MAG: type II toxin-antitoxin system HigB family toxin [Bryobacteraceae bacterium]